MTAETQARQRVGGQHPLGVLLQRFEQWPAGVHLAISLVALAVIAFLDVISPKDVSFSIFYLVPVVWAAWFAGRWTSAVIAVLASLAWGAMDMLAGITSNAPTIAVWNELARLGLFLVVWLMLSEVRQISADRQRLALSDPLTGAANIRVLGSEIEREIQRLRRFGRPFALAYLDLDQFKAVNDTLGHRAGDDVLRGVAAFLDEQARGFDTVARLGGDEFAILMPETDEDAARAALERVADGLADVVRLAAPTVEGVGASIGASVFLGAPWSVDQALSLADGLMYEAKRAGGGTTALRVYAGDGASAA